MNIADIQHMLSYNQWANERILESLRSLSQEQLERDLKSSHRSIRGTLAHLASAEWIWLERWTGKSPTHLLPESDFETVEMACRRLGQFDQNLMAYASRLSEADLNQSHTYLSTEGKSYKNILREMILHVVNHSSYHRGQIVAMSRQVGLAPPGTDFILFCRR